jgi:hypothetical protein
MPGSITASTCIGARIRRRREAARLEPHLARRLEQLDRVPVGIFDLDLPAARTGFHVVSKMEADCLQSLNERRKVVDAKYEFVRLRVVAAPSFESCDSSCDA